MKNKKICILTSVHPAFDNRIFYKETKTLVRAGYDITLIAQYSKNEIVDGVKIIALPISSKPRYQIYLISGLIKQLGRGYKAYKIALKQKANIYHFHDPELLPWMVRLKKKTETKVVYDAHENTSAQILSNYRFPKILRYVIAASFSFFEKKLSKKIDFIITATDNIEAKFKNINSNVKSIKNFPILDYFNNIKRESFFSKENFILVYVGALAEIRGIAQIVQAMEYLPDNVKLKLLGRFSPEDYENKIKNLKGFRKVDFLGWMCFDKIPHHLSQADIGMICLWPEPNYINSSTPTKLFEYMAAGLPTIASNFPLWKEIIEGNKCGICINPLNPKEIAKAIKYLIGHPGEAKRMGENGKKAVLEKYNWENESKKLLKIYEKLTEK